MNHTIRPLRFSGASLLILLFGLVMTGCDDEFVADPRPVTAFEGVQETFESGAMGRAIGDVSDDWLPLPEVGVRISRAYPNPTSGKVGITFDLATVDSLRFWLESAPGKLDMELYGARMGPGTHALEFDLTGHAPGIYRLYMTIYGNGAHTTYGDIMVR